MVEIFLLLAATCLVFTQGVATACDIVGEAKQVRQNNRAAYVDISDIVKKCLASTPDRNAVAADLKAQKFLVYDSPAKDGTRTLIALYEMKGLLGIGFHDEINVVVVFVDNWVFRTNVTADSGLS